MNEPLARLQHHVTGAIERGEAEAIIEQPAQPAPKLRLVMNIPEAERKIEIDAESIPRAALKLLQQIELEFSQINPDVLDSLADLIRQNEFDGVEFPESEFNDLSCPEDNFTLKVQPIPAAPKHPGYTPIPIPQTH